MKKKQMASYLRTLHSAEEKAREVLRANRLSPRRYHLVYVGREGGELFHIFADSAERGLKVKDATITPVALKDISPPH